MQQPKKRILIVEDDPGLLNSLRELFSDENYTVFCISSLANIESEAKQADLIVLDWRLPDGQGIDAMSILRAKGHLLPIIMLTAKADLIDKILGLEAGANDYLTKPFEPRELLARVRAQLRSQTTEPPTAEKDTSTVIKIGELSIEPRSRKVIHMMKSLDLTKLEYELLLLLASEPERVFSRDEILNKVWGYENFPTTRTVDTHILQLRQKISSSFFETIRGVGYRFKFAE
ncbi:DNA-binding response regulator [Candidatus Kaiserbacteria bacterium]|nr:MAG: DNA-binding response regulator [Candidatus Kaiserbacteria bacterium]